MGTSTEVEVRSRGLDLTRAPSEQWNQEMLDLVAKSVFRGQEITKTQLHFCLAVAEGIGLNPMIGEVYFIPAKSHDGKGPALLPYVGRNGLVRKAEEAGYYYESDTVHEQDKFTVRRTPEGVKVTHAYGTERGEIVGAYAFLHDRAGRERPAFFYAKLDEYLPTFDQDWKMDKSPWGNQRSAMIEKCAMIGAGRKRLNLGNVLADGEVARVQQMQEIRPGSRPALEQPPPAFDWSSLEASGELVERLHEAVARLNEISPGSWPPAKVEMMMRGKSEGELAALAGRLEGEANRLASEDVVGAAGRSEGDVGGSSPEPEVPAEGLTEAVSGELVDERAAFEAEKNAKRGELAERAERLVALRRRAGELEEALIDVGSEEEREMLTAELDQVEQEIAATEMPGQGTLGV